MGSDVEGGACPEERTVSEYVCGASLPQCKKHSLFVCLGLSRYPISVCTLCSVQGQCVAFGWETDEQQGRNLQSKSSHTFPASLSWEMSRPLLVGPNIMV